MTTSETVCAVCGKGSPQKPVRYNTTFHKMDDERWLCESCLVVDLTKRVTELERRVGRDTTG